MGGRNSTCIYRSNIVCHQNFHGCYCEEKSTITAFRCNLSFSTSWRRKVGKIRVFAPFSLCRGGVTGAKTSCGKAPATRALRGNFPDVALPEFVLMTAASERQNPARRGHGPAAHGGQPTSRPCWNVTSGIWHASRGCMSFPGWWASLPPGREDCRILPRWGGLRASAPPRSSATSPSCGPFIYTSEFRVGTGTSKNA